MFFDLLVGCISHGETGVMGCGREDHRDSLTHRTKCPKSMNNQDDLYINVNLDHRAKVASVRPHHGIVSLFSPLSTLDSERKSLYIALI
jgi:hypothetical protein